MECLPCSSEKRCDCRTLLVLGGFAVAEGLLCFLLHQSVHGQVGTGSVFSRGVADIVVLVFARLVLVSLLVVIGYRVWLRSLRQRCSSGATNGDAANGRAYQMDTLGGSLLSADSEQGQCSPGSGPQFSNGELDEERRLAEQSRRGESCRDIAIWCIFFVCSVCAVYSGVKCVSFGEGDAFGSTASFSTLLLGLEVFLCHGHFYAAKKLLVKLTTSGGILLPWLHPHQLYFVEKADARMCQTCRSKIQHSNHNAMAYYCPLCERHYYCIACLKRQVRQRSTRSTESVEEASRQAAAHSSALGYMRRVLPLVKPFLHVILLSFVTVAVNQSFKIAAPHWQGSVLDTVVKGDRAAFQHSIVMYLAINLGNGFFSSVQTSTVLLVMRRLMFRTRLTVFRHILRQDIAYFDANLAGQITSRLTNDINQMTDPVSILMNNLLSNAILLAGGLFMCFHTSWRLSILAMTAIFPITYLVRNYSEWAGKIARKIMDEMAEANGAATQAIQNMRTVRYFGAEHLELGRYENNLSNVYKLQMKDNIIRICNSTFTNYLDLSVGVFVLWYGGGVIIEGDQQHLSLGQLITFQLYWNMMKNAFNGLNDVLSSLMRATSASQRVLDLLDLQPSIETGGGVAIERKEDVDGAITFDDVTFHYAQKRSQKPVLCNVSISFPSGQVTALVGKSGSGKSTMASLLLRLYDPITGQILLDGKPFKSFQPQSLRAIFGVVAQETQLFAGTVEDNVAYAQTSPYSKEDLEQAARKANALEFIQKSEDGFQTLVGDRGMLLSGGQKQRISIARMFLRQPRILLLDEATSALDTENEALVQKALDDLVASGICRTVIVIAHRLSTVRDAHQIAVMEEGELKELGTHDELLQKSDGIYTQLVARQLQPTAERENGADESGGRDESLARNRARRAKSHAKNS
eukprot:TRINITY_DN33380_c0_g1_i1.p1 TRINITY_DN33380_c0_g1~~TRINITY_DN33380_c0_g1_i1.p1  ORF type:complete len:946 (-),score=170.96 TRINITY_DN33380_c0_g1_i1:25-2778(-)